MELLICYARKDQSYLEELKLHLMPLRRQGLIQTWCDADISPGTPWEEEIDKHLNTAQIILLLLSPDFMASEYCYDKEMKHAMERHEKGEARVIPVILRPVHWREAPFGKLQALPKEAKPVRIWPERDAAFFSVVEGIRDAIEDITKSFPAHQQEASLEQLSQDITTYAAYVERTLQNLKIAGVIPRYQADKDADISLNSIFVPPRVILQGQSPFEEQLSILTLFEQHSCVVLLGGPGSGKSTAVRYLAWSHAAAHMGTALPSALPPLPDKPLPLRIELRRLIEDRRHQPEHDFLSYITRVILGREGIKVKDQMFKELLQQKRMLLLFDGLDEVATLAERRRLVEEIEHFALAYPGNRILVTSRLVGYESASCSKSLFSHGWLQPFNNEQIRQFLELWYTHVLQMSPIPYEEQQEIEKLYEILKDNPRLHRLAENPLLLTVITALYRHERLPDRRVQVYDKCAELLLERWAKLKGTDIRWEKMKMSREDQYACIAHLGFVLHKRSQGQENDARPTPFADTTASDVPIKFLSQEIVKFLNNQHLIIQLTEQRAEAERFLAMMQEEVGLVVERGKDEDGESLYGFIHQTFQEYFAAVDVHERFQQEQDPTILAKFLAKYLHSPYWREVIFLLLGKLKRKPVTALLRQIHEGKLKSYRSQYADLLQQDLFFICDSFLEEISVEIELAEVIMSHLGSLVRYSHILAQRIQAANYLGQLTRTRQYAPFAKEISMDLIRDITLDIQIKLYLFENIYQYISLKSNEYKDDIELMLVNTFQNDQLSANSIVQALKAFSLGSQFDAKVKLVMKADMIILQRADLSDTLYIDRLIDAAWHLKELYSLSTQEERQIVIRLLMVSAKRSDLPAGQVMRILQSLYLLEADQEFADQKLLGLVQSANLPPEQTLQALEVLYRYSFKGSEEEQYAVQHLMELAHHPRNCFEQAVQTARSLWQYSGGVKQGREELGLQMLLSLAQHCDDSFEHILLANKWLLWASRRLDGEKRRAAFQRLLCLAQHPESSAEQIIQVTKAVFFASLTDEEEEQVNQILLSLLERPSLLVEQKIQAAYYLYWCNGSSTKIRRQAAKLLLNIAYQHDISAEQIALAAQSLISSKIYDLDNYSTEDVQLEEERQAVQRLWQLIQEPKISVERKLQIIASILEAQQVTYRDKAQAVQTVLSLLESSAAKLYFEEHWLSTYTHVGYTSFEANITDVPSIVELAVQELLPVRVRDWAYSTLEQMIPQFNEI